MIHSVRTFRNLQYQARPYAAFVEVSPFVWCFLDLVSANTVSRIASQEEKIGLYHRFILTKSVNSEIRPHNSYVSLNRSFIRGVRPFMLRVSDIYSSEV